MTSPASPTEAFACLAEMLQEASDAVEDDPFAARACLARATLLLREVQARHAPEAAAERADQAPGLGLARWQLNRVLLHVDQHLGESLLIRDLAQLIGLSPGHFARAFRRSTGAAPRAFVLERRVARAKQLMRTTDLPLSEIALACGLSDQAHLSRIFRRYTGNTPNAWRREWHDRPSPAVGRGEAARVASM
ncbi:AraC family transcriptional regulator [Rhodopseudomonas sp. BR0M22]|uniref:helix-turn-helix domain-containing protein n=1 Tax=Rhodopseudomonas sp. BR0M22 TaxID=2269369 RepID=UPI0013DFB98C|nr:AraC family transcriptional regulator [Rhodopseudomonas sp. BR0M22]MCD0419427.1 AraC family transcriptional regulator [Rubrivivax sp. JA1024]NEW91137.1 AraC family transcriptional regulator [Rhodopseudomonas sp. BR0M22]